MHAELVITLTSTSLSLFVVEPPAWSVPQPGDSGILVVSSPTCDSRDEVSVGDISRCRKTGWPDVRVVSEVHLGGHLEEGEVVVRGLRVVFGVLDDLCHVHAERSRLAASVVVMFAKENLIYQVSDCFLPPPPVHLKARGSVTIRTVSGGEDPLVADDRSAAPHESLAFPDHPNLSDCVGVLLASSPPARGTR